MLNIASLIKTFVSLLFILFISLLSFTAQSEEDKHSNLKKGVFLVASEQLSQSPLGQTVIYITQHDDAGTSGFIINRPTDLQINEAFPETHASTVTNKLLFFGGPLHTQYLFMLTQTQFSHGLHSIQQNIYFGTGEEAKMRLRSENKRDKIRTYAGFMSWGPDQLDQEINQGDWILTPATPDQLFSQDTSKLWQTLHNRWAGSWI